MLAQLAKVSYTLIMITPQVTLGKCYEEATMLQVNLSPFIFVKFMIEKVRYGNVVVHLSMSDEDYS